MFNSLNKFFFFYAGICRKCRTVVYEQISNLHEEDIDCDASEPEVCKKK